MKMIVLSFCYSNEMKLNETRKRRLIINNNINFDNADTQGDNTITRNEIETTVSHHDDSN